jgi:hypothetical protein
MVKCGVLFEVRTELAPLAFPQMFSLFFYSYTILSDSRSLRLQRVNASAWSSHERLCARIALLAVFSLTLGGSSQTSRKADHKCKCKCNSAQSSASDYRNTTTRIEQCIFALQMAAGSAVPCYGVTSNENTDFFPLVWITCALLLICNLRGYTVVP